MNEVQQLEQERTVMRWGALSGLLGVILFLAAIVFGIFFMGADPPDLVGWVTRFPEIKMIRVVENLTYLLGLVLQLPLFLALFMALRKTSLAPALFGSAIGILGLCSLVVSTTPHVAHAKLAALYNAAGTTATDQANIVLMWQAIWGLNDVMVYIGFLVIPLGIFTLGAAMFSSPDFGKGLGGLSMLLATIGFAAALYQMVDTASMASFASFLSYLVFYLVLSWKLYRLSRVSQIFSSPDISPLSTKRATSS